MNILATIAVVLAIQAVVVQTDSLCAVELKNGKLVRSGPCKDRDNLGVLNQLRKSVEAKKQGSLRTTTAQPTASRVTPTQTPKAVTAKASTSDSATESTVMTGSNIPVKDTAKVSITTDSMSASASKFSGEKEATTTRTNDASTSLLEISESSVPTTVTAESSTTDSATEFTMTESNIPVKDLCQFEYDETCYWTVIRPTPRVNFTQAEQICRGNGSEPAVFYKEMNSSIFMENFRALIPPELTVIVLWTGNRFDPEVGTASAGSGTVAPFFRWFPDFPEYDSSCTHVALVVDKDPAQDQGIANVSPSPALHGVVCQD